MSNENSNTDNQEQIKNKKSIPEDFFHQLQIILDKDQYDIFKTKTKKVIEEKIKSTESHIQKLLELKLQSTGTIKQLQTQIESLVSDNAKLKTSIIKNLKLEI